MNTSFNGQHPGNNEHTHQRFGPADPKSLFPSELHNPSQVFPKYFPNDLPPGFLLRLIRNGGNPFESDNNPYDYDDDDDDREFTRRSPGKSWMHKLAQFFASKQKTTNAHKKDARIMSDDQISQVITITGLTSASFEGGHTVNQQGLGGINFNAFNDNRGGGAPPASGGTGSINNNYSTIQANTGDGGEHGNIEGATMPDGTIHD